MPRPANPGFTQIRFRITWASGVFLERSYKNWAHTVFKHVCSLIIQDRGYNSFKSGAIKVLVSSRTFFIP